MEATHTNGRDYRMAMSQTPRCERYSTLSPIRSGIFARRAASPMTTEAIPEEEVRAILKQYPEYVQAFDFPNHTGEPVYTLRHPGWRRRLRQYRKIFSVYVSMEVP